MGSYFCCSLRCMSLSGIDPSLALGFYCRSTGLCRCLVSSSLTCGRCVLILGWHSAFAAPCELHVLHRQLVESLSSAIGACDPEHITLDSESGTATDDLEHLCQQLAQLEAASKGAPLLCVEHGSEEPDYNSMELSSPSSSDAASKDAPAGKLDDWELM